MFNGALEDQQLSKVLYLKSMVTLPDLLKLPKVAVFLRDFVQKKTHSRKDEYLTELQISFIYIYITVSLTRQRIILKAEFLGYRWVILQAEVAVGLMALKYTSEESDMHTVDGSESR